MNCADDIQVIAKLGRLEHFNIAHEVHVMNLQQSEINYHTLLVKT